jgi:hypothetical protein
MRQKSGLSLFWRIVLTLALVLFYNQILSLIPFPVLGKLWTGRVFRIYPREFGITPFISACFFVTLIYYILRRSSKPPCVAFGPRYDVEDASGRHAHFQPLFRVFLCIAGILCMF